MEEAGVGAAKVHEATTAAVATMVKESFIFVIG